MDKFISVPIGIVSNDQAKLQKNVTAKVQASEIAYTYPGFYDGTIVVMKSGQSFFCTISQDDLHALILEQ